MLRRRISPLTISVLINLCALFTLSRASAHLGTDADELYAYSDSLHGDDPDSPIHTFSSIVGTGTALSLSDDRVEGPIDLGFTFNYYDVDYTQVWISSNGWLSFQSNTSAYNYSSEIPYSNVPNALIAFIWEDLNPSNGGDIVYQTRGAAGHQSFVVEFNEVPHYSTGNLVTVQVELIEGQDEILIHFDQDSDESGTHTIGIENEDGTSGIEYYRGSMADIDLDGQTIRFFPLRDAPRLSIVTPDPTIPEGGTLDLEVNAVDRQGGEITIEWDVNLDGSYGDVTGTTATVSAVGVDGPGVALVGVRATDTDGNADTRLYELPVVNVQPVFVDFPESLNVVLGDEFTFIPTIEDPGDDEIFVTLENVSDTMIVLAGGGIRWIPQVQDLGEHVVTFRAVDDDYVAPEEPGEGEDPPEDEATIQQLTLFVTDNEPPGAPIIVSPQRGEVVDVLRPLFVIENPVDPEGDALFISFDVDESDSYAFPISSGRLLAGEDGQTSWTVSEDLQWGVRYNWRACATDGHSESVCISSHFETIAGEGGDAGPDACECDCETYVDSGCTVTGSRGIKGSLGALAVLLLTLVCSRLRRRRPTDE